MQHEIIDFHPQIIKDFIEFARECIPDLQVSLDPDRAIIIFEDETGIYEVLEADIIRNLSADIGKIRISLQLVSRTTYIPE